MSLLPPETLIENDDCAGVQKKNQPATKKEIEANSLIFVIIFGAFVFVLYLLLCTMPWHLFGNWQIVETQQDFEWARLLQSFTSRSCVYTIFNL